MKGGVATPPLPPLYLPVRCCVNINDCGIHCDTDCLAVDCAVSMLLSYYGNTHNMHITCILHYNYTFLFNLFFDDRSILLQKLQI